MEEIGLVNGDNNYDILHMGKDAFDWVVLLSVNKNYHEYRIKGTVR
jgi:hypothetical protein